MRVDKEVSHNGGTPKWMVYKITFKIDNLRVPPFQECGTEGRCFLICEISQGLAIVLGKIISVKCELSICGQIYWGFRGTKNGWFLREAPKIKWMMTRGSPISGSLHLLNFTRSWDSKTQYTPGLMQGPQSYPVKWQMAPAPAQGRGLAVAATHLKTANKLWKLLSWDPFVTITQVIQQAPTSQFGRILVATSSESITAGPSAGWNIMPPVLWRGLVRLVCSKLIPCGGVQSSWIPELVNPLIYHPRLVGISFYPSSWLTYCWWEEILHHFQRPTLESSRS